MDNAKSAKSMFRYSLQQTLSAAYGGICSLTFFFPQKNCPRKLMLCTRMCAKCVIFESIFFQNSCQKKMFPCSPKHLYHMECVSYQIKIALEMSSAVHDMVQNIDTKCVSNFVN